MCIDLSLRKPDEYAAAPRPAVIIPYARGVLNLPFSVKRSSWGAPQLFKRVRANEFMRSRQLESISSPGCGQPLYMKKGKTKQKT